MTRKRMITFERAIALSCTSRTSRPVAESRALVVEQPSFALDAAAVAGERAIGADHAMTRHHHADGIGPVGKADGPNGFVISGLRRERAVAKGLPRRDPGERGPYGALERRAGRAPLDGAKASDLPAEITPQQALDVARRGTRFRHERSVVQAKQTGHAGFTIGPIERTKVAGFIRDNQRFADRRCQPIQSQAFRRLAGHEAPFLIGRRRYRTAAARYLTGRDYILDTYDFSRRCNLRPRRRTDRLWMRA